MPTVYQRRQKIPELKGRVRGGLAVVVRSPQEIAGLQRLVTMAAALPGDGLENAYRILANAGDSLEKWPGFVPAFRGPNSETSAEAGWEIPTELEDPKAAALFVSLGLAERVWNSQSKDADNLALALVLPRPGHRVSFKSDRPSFVLDYGSIRGRVLAAGARLREFGVALFPVARSKRQSNLVEALRAHAVGTRLPRLESIRPSDLAGKPGVVIFLHGLVSTDVGTFDAFVERLETAADQNGPLLVSWPHDTLDPIELNAEQLSEVIQHRLGPSSLPIAFVCHSRGGLVARRTIVELLEVNAQWQPRIRACVTFGTPHDGAELAEFGDELLGKIMLLQTVRRQAGYVPLVDALWTVYDRRKLPGITDLRPRKNGGEFLRRLRKAEGRLAKKAGAVPVPLFAVGGNAQLDGMTGWLSRRFFGATPHDLVVTVPSSAPSDLAPTAETTCDHFSYFTRVEMNKQHAGEAVRFLQQALAGPARHRQPSRLHRGDGDRSPRNMVRPKPRGNMSRQSRAASVTSVRG
jgi:hypothetical protein